jgi:hypothetical protein
MGGKNEYTYRSIAFMFGAILSISALSFVISESNSAIASADPSYGNQSGRPERVGDTYLTVIVI